MIIHPAPSEIKEEKQTMTEIEKMQRYIERTKMKEKSPTSYAMNYSEAAELAHKARGSNLPIEVISLAFEYGKAKGYRAAKAEVRV